MTKRKTKKKSPGLKTLSTGILRAGGNEGVFGKVQEIPRMTVDLRCPDCPAIAKAGAGIIVHAHGCEAARPLEKWEPPA